MRSNKGTTMTVKRNGSGMNDPDLKVCLARLDERLKALNERLCRADIERDKAIEIARSELARRLDILNHSHEQAVLVQARYVPREINDAAHERLVERIDNNEKQIAKALPYGMGIAIVAAAIGGAVTRYLLG